MPVAQTKDSVLFIVNPVHERRLGIKLKQLLNKYLDLDRFDYDIIYSVSPEQIFELIQVKKPDYQIFVAAGGDGTVNSVGKCLIHSENVLGIIPLGSGNGLARSLKISLNPRNAIKAINKLNISVIDTGMVNDIPFMHMAGIGYCGAVTQRYEKLGIRGLFAYIYSLVVILFRYNPKEYEIRIGKKSEKVTAFLIEAGNTSQWGYNIHICPEADPADGFLDLCIIKKFPIIIFPFMICRLLMKRLNRSRYTEMIRANKAEVEGIGEMIGHIDGDPTFFNQSMDLKILPGSLKIITGNI